MKLIDNINDLLGDDIKQYVQPSARLKNYMLQSSSANRSAGALLNQTYMSPAPFTFLPE